MKIGIVNFKCICCYLILVKEVVNFYLVFNKIVVYFFNDLIKFYEIWIEDRIY